MAEQRIGLARQIAFYLATNPVPPTLGDLMSALRCAKGTAIGERLREARGYYGFAIEHFIVRNGAEIQHRYFMPAVERTRVRATDAYKAWQRTRKEAA